jgi:hypothetical protein
MWALRSAERAYPIETWALRAGKRACPFAGRTVRTETAIAHSPLPAVQFSFPTAHCRSLKACLWIAGAHVGGPGAFIRISRAHVPGRITERADPTVHSASPPSSSWACYGEVLACRRRVEV